MRAASAELQRELVALRRSLLAHAGHADKDYQKLRASRAAQADEDDDAAVPPPPPAVTPTPAGAGPDLPPVN